MSIIERKNEKKLTVYSQLCFIIAYFKGLLYLCPHSYYQLSLNKVLIYDLRQKYAKMVPHFKPLPLARRPCPLQIFLFWYPHQKGGRGRAAQGQKSGGGGMTSVELRRWLGQSVLKGACGRGGDKLDSFIPIANMTSNVGYLTLLLLLLLLSVRLLLTVLGSSCRGCYRLMAAATSTTKASNTCIIF